MAKQKMNDITGIVIGTIVSIIICILAIAGMSKMLLSGKIGEASIEIGINAVVMISAFLGCLLTNGLTGKAVLNNIISTITLLCILFLSAFLVDGAFKNVLWRMVSVMVGSLVSCTISLKKSKYQKSPKRRYR